MLSEWSPIVLQLSLLMIVGGILGVISWIGYVMATTKSSPSSIILGSKIVRPVGPRFYQTVVDVKIEKQD